jgi:hypothetical protein
VTLHGTPVELLDLGDPKLSRMHRRIRFRRGDQECAGYTLANFLKRHRRADPAPSMLLPCPQPGETWATEAGTTCTIVDGGDQSLPRRERRVTFDRDGRRSNTWRVSCFIHYWTRIAAAPGRADMSERAA